ncbi:type II toxin-antitoxin system RelE/ParE family toxin [Sphingomonas trueperi]|uniref:type II toxin-antitoxin system RelE/ParE family toxin n=1 Tax=Sphingomonas trueperi TaxID=53317 RepID=UPI000EB29940
MRELVWTTPAIGDLQAIDTWLSEHRSPDLARRRLAKLRERAEFLIEFPHLGRPGDKNVRILRAFDTPYVIVYRLKGEKLEILRIRHEREDWLVIR